MRVRYRPARTIGGDFYMSISVPGERLLAAVGDVSGKGIPAALTTAQITAEIHAHAHLVEKGGLGDYVTALNDELCQRLARGRFAATTFLFHHPHHNTVEVICAGQFAPWRYRNDAWEEIKIPQSLPLGVIRGQEYRATTVPALPGEIWVLFSDGINEGRSPTGEDYGTDRLRESLGGGHVAGMLKRAWSSWENFVDGEHQHDDACLALILLKPPASLEIGSAARNCKQAREFIEAWALTAGFPDLVRGPNRSRRRRGRDQHHAAHVSKRDRQDHLALRRSHRGPSASAPARPRAACRFCRDERPRAGGR